MATSGQENQATYATLSGPGVGLQNLLRKPLVLAYAVVTARRVWLTGLVLVLALLFVVKPAVQFGIRQVLPPVKDSKLFGLVKREKPREAAHTIYRLFTLLAWVSIGGVVVVRFRRHLPEGVARAETLSGNWVREADTLTESSPTRSRRLYRAAMLLTLDPDTQRQLEARMAALRSSAAEATAVWGPTAADSAATARVETAGIGSLGPDERYLLLEKLGEGAMGVVYRGRDRVLERVVAFKQLSTRLVGDPVYLERFTLEARALARLSHPHIVQVFDLVRADEAVWMVLEYVEGGTLAEYLKRQEKLRPAEAADLIGDIADGLAVAHGAGIIHRDIKPANILLTADHRAKLTDFGIAKLASAATLTQAGATLGSPAYMSPEQCNGAGLDERSDVYSLGITLYELLSGQPPFGGDTTGILAQHMVGTPAPLSRSVAGVAEPLDQLVLRMLAKQPGDRPQTMAEVRDQLRAFCLAARTGPIRV